MKKIYYLLASTIILASCKTSESTTETALEVEYISGRITKIDGIDIYAHQLASNQDTIEYIHIGNDTLSTKPCILFLQGSLPKPLIYDLGNYKHVNLPFDYKSLIDQYHIIEIAMPHTPVLVGKKNLNAQYCYVPDTSNPKQYELNYLTDNFLDHYVQRAHAVISDLKLKGWIDLKKVHLIGHSQGAKIASVVASQDSSIHSVAFLGFNAYGRLDESVRRLRTEVETQNNTDSLYQLKLNGLYNFWESVISNPNDVKSGFNSWSSFSKSYIPYLVNTQVPVYIAYGTKDVIAQNCDLLPLEFITHGKKNWKLKPYLGLDHNFFEVKDGVPDRRNGARFSEVVNEYLYWSENQ